MTKPIFVAHISIVDVPRESAKFLIEKLDDWHVVVSSDITSNKNRFEAFAVEKIEHIDFEILKQLLLKDIEDEFDI